MAKNDNCTKLLKNPRKKPATSVSVKPRLILFLKMILISKSNTNITFNPIIPVLTIFV